MKKNALTLIALALTLSLLFYARIAIPELNALLSREIQKAQEAQGQQ